jgi:hypothetical protein
MMERIARRLVTSLVLWLLVLCSAAVPSRLASCHHHACPHRHHSGQRPYVPARRGAILSRQDESVKPSCMPQGPAREVAVREPTSTHAASHQDVSPEAPGLPNQPRYLLLRALLI